MLGLFGLLDLGARSLQTQQQGVEVAGHNLANVNNPDYARQRLLIQPSMPLPTAIGSEGTGVEAVAISQLRNSLLDQQIQGETSVTGFLQTQQNAFLSSQTALGEQLDSNGNLAGGLASDLNGLFNSFQTLSASPASGTSRQSVIASAQQLATQFHQVDQRLGTVQGQLNQSLQSDVSQANKLLADIAGLNQQIGFAQAGSGGTANDLNDLRQQKLEQLAQLVNFQSAPMPNGAINISIGGQLLVSGSAAQDTLQAYDAGGGQLLIRTAASSTDLSLAGGSIQGAIDARDTTIGSLRTGLNQLASQLISQVNTAYRGGYDLHGNTGADFFTGANAADINVNPALVSDPSTLQASGQSGAAGDGQIALSLAQLANTKLAGLGNQTFSGNYNGVVSALGFSLATANNQLSDQQAVQNMLLNQRTAVSGVSIDEEMTNLVKFQRAFQASAHLMSTIDQMLSDVVNMKQ
jgi:flagellar hook-associated protein 1 FlgK